jgi:hypothetical protein
MTWEAQLLKSLNGMPVAYIILFLVGILTYVAYRLWNLSGNGETDWLLELFETKVNEKSTLQGPVTKIWDPALRGESVESERIYSFDSEGKPFGSSYYYAHNNLRKTGGYSDGLRMEDYQMETPRLLSKRSMEANIKVDEASLVVPEKTTTNSKNSGRDVFTPIVKYLWDDPGNRKAVGTIRIDQLEENTFYEGSKVEDVLVKLESNTKLSVVIFLRDGAKYKLNIPRLYGKVKEAKKVDKGTRLLIRLYKCNDSSADKDNIKQWPTPFKNA